MNIFLDQVGKYFAMQTWLWREILLTICFPEGKTVLQILILFYNISCSDFLIPIFKMHLKFKNNEFFSNNDNSVWKIIEFELCFR